MGKSSKNSFSFLGAETFAFTHLQLEDRDKTGDAKTNKHEVS